MRHFRLLCFLTAFVVAACARGPKVESTDPYLVPKKEFRETVKILAVAPVTLPDGLPDPGPIEGTFNQLIEEQLRRGGYAIVRPHEYTGVWGKLVGDNGDFIDPETGQRDVGRLASTMFQAMTMLQADFDVDAAMIPSVDVVEAPFAGGRAVWDGASQSINTGGPMKGFLAGSPDGMLGALSLTITVFNEQGDTLFANAGGIEVLSKMDGKEFVLVPRQELFSDQERVEKSVRIALDPLMK